MSSYFATEDRVANLGSLTLASGTAVFNVGKPIDVKRIVLVYTTGQTGAGAALTFGVRNADGSTGSVTKGSFTAPVAVANAVVAAEVAGVYPNPVVNTGEQSQPTTVTTGRVLGYQTNQPGIIKVNPGQQFWVTGGAGGAAGVAQVYIEYEEEGNQPLRYVPTIAAVTLL
jgi:hypothetical protein